MFHSLKRCKVGKLSTEFNCVLMGYKGLNKYGDKFISIVAYKYLYYELEINNGGCFWLWAGDTEGTSKGFKRIGKI